MATGIAAVPVTIHDFRRSLEWALQDVFSTMFNQTVEVVPDEDISNVSGITAIVGFGGKVSGFLALHMSAEAACSIAQGLLGMEFECVDDTVCDAVGELVNMLAGGLKKNLSRQEELFKLSIPSIINGQEYRTHAPSDAVKLTVGVNAGPSNVSSSPLQHGTHFGTRTFGNKQELFKFLLGLTSKSLGNDVHYGYSSAADLVPETIIFAFLELLIYGN